MQRTRVKICGITRPEDALAACELGADALGFVCWEQSPRHVDMATVAAIVRRLPAFVTPVALFVDPAPERVRAAIDAGCTLLQFHGDESPQDCARHGQAYIKAVRMAPGVDLQALARDYAGARGLLLDAHVAGVPGGTGRTFDWTRVPRDLPLPVILAGGLDAGNVGGAIRTARPWAVDVSGGVEQAKGIKDRARIAEFMAGVAREHD